MAIVTTPALPAAVAIGLAAEVDIDAFREKVWHLLDQKFMGTYWHIVWMGLDYAVVYTDADGKMLHIGYKMDGNELVETDTYEVAFTRVEEVKTDMNEVIEAAANTNVETPNVEEVAAVADAVIDTNTVEEQPNAENAAEEPVEAACGDEKPETAEIENEIDDDIKNESDSDAHDVEEARDDDIRVLREQVAELQAQLATYREAEARAQIAEKQAAARKYAEREGLNLEAENVKAAIENADYEALAAEVMAKPVEKNENESYRVVAEMKISPYGNMFDKA